MDDTGNRRANYVGRVHEDTQRIVRELMNENEKLRRLAAQAEQENSTLQERLQALTVELERHENEKRSLRQQLDDIATESRRYSEQYAEVEQRSANLASLYVSSYQLHGTLDREAVLTTIKEIVINLIGSEELGVFEVSEDGNALELVTSFGISETTFARLNMVTDPIARLAASGETYVAGSSAAPQGLPRLTVCLPLKLDGRVTGAVVLFSLLDHKPGLQELDLELLDLLGTHAATALYCTGLHARMTAGLVA